MESRTHCAYNQTRECFLGLEVSSANLPFAGVEELVSTLTLKSGEGFWLNPFKGVPAINTPFPMDVIYLDEYCRVIEFAESIPAFQASSSDTRLASVLLLPAHSIYSSQTEPGDQLVLCVAREMEQRLERIRDSRDETNCTPMQGHEDDADVEIDLSKGNKSLSSESAAVPATHAKSLLDMGRAAFRPPTNWLASLWRPDPRHVPRKVVPGLVAYYWTGAPPKEHRVRDISMTGLYLITEDHWYPGTLVLMTLQKTASEGRGVEDSISVQARVVRCGSDGVGLQFLLREARGTGNPIFKTVDSKTLEQFLQKLGKAK